MREIKYTKLPSKEQILCVAVGFVTGACLQTAAQKLTKPVGKLMIDDTDPEKTLYNFQIDDLGVLDNKKSLTLKIERVNAQQ